MKKLLKFTNLIGAAALISGLAACASTAAVPVAQKETLLSQAGFVTKTVTSPKQKQQVEKLPVGVVSAVKYQGKLLYIYPTATKDHIYVGRQTEYNKYKAALQAQAARIAQASAAQQPQGTAPDGAYLTGETAGPNRIIVQEFDGFGPIQDNPAWQ